MIHSGLMYKVVSLFAGAGGMDLGLEQAGMKVIWANDIDSDSCKTYRMWSDAVVVQGDIAQIDFTTIPNADVIVGGFPCQGFSLAGPRRLNDERNALYKHFVWAVAEKKPYAFIAENVKGILTLGKGIILEIIVNNLEALGYNVTYKLLNAADYGTHSIGSACFCWITKRSKYHVFFSGTITHIGLHCETHWDV